MIEQHRSALIEAIEEVINVRIEFSLKHARPPYLPGVPISATKEYKEVQAAHKKLADALVLYERELTYPRPIGGLS